LDTNTIIQVVKVIESLSEDSIVIISTHADLPLITYVINGKSGSGKTTLLNILSSMYNDYSGNLKLNSIELKDINPESLLNKISFGVQDYYVDNGGIFNLK